jgi:hypothetical protein
MIKIVKDFSYAPGPRYIREGKNSGEQFRRELLTPAIKEAISKKQKLTVDLDGTAGYGRSFLEESFGGLIREDKLDYQSVLDILEVVSHEQPSHKEKIYGYLKQAYEKEQQKLVKASSD